MIVTDRNPHPHATLVAALRPLLRHAVANAKPNERGELKKMLEGMAREIGPAPTPDEQRSLGFHQNRYSK